MTAKTRSLGYKGKKRDIGARKQQIESALRASKARFRTVVEALAEAVILRDADGRIVDCNASAERIFGRTLAQMKGSTRIGSDWRIFREDGSPMPEDERPSVAARRTGLPQSGVVVRYRKPDRSELWMMINVQPLFDGAVSSPAGFVSTITDISKVKRSELEIVRLNVELENRVLRRTAQLEAANKELEAFSYSVAHDLRTPLNIIEGFCALLQKALPPDSWGRANQHLSRIRAGVLHMSELIDGLLSLAQISRTSLRWETVDLSAEARKILDQCAESDAARVVQTTIEPRLLVRADGPLLRQVLENLIGNAWKFTSKKPCAEILVGKQIGADEQTVYFVRDNGAGFDMAYANKLFGTFQRLHSPEEFTGSGIGLATVKRIIARHGGRLWADSAVGEGSTFYFTLGSNQDHTVPSARPHDKDSGVASAQFSHSPHLIKGVADVPAGSIAGTSIHSNNETFSVGEQQFSHAFEHAAIGMALLDLDFRWLRVNNAFCQMVGYAEAEIFAHSSREIILPDDNEAGQRQLSRALAGEIETYRREIRLIHKSGRIVWVYVTCSLVRDPDRRPLHFITQIQDISNLKQAEQILRENDERFRSLTALPSDCLGPCWDTDVA